MDGATSGMESKRIRSDEPRAAGCGVRALRTYSKASAVSASDDSRAARSFRGPTSSRAARPSGLWTYRPRSARSDSNSRSSALEFCKGSFQHGERALRQAVARQFELRNPGHAVDIACSLQLATHR